VLVVVVVVVVMMMRGRRRRRTHLYIAYVQGYHLTQHNSPTQAQDNQVSTTTTTTTTATSTTTTTYYYHPNYHLLLLLRLEQLTSEDQVVHILIDSSHGLEGIHQ